LDHFNMRIALINVRYNEGRSPNEEPHHDFYVLGLRPRSTQVPRRTC
jgi:hypothetical protein